MFIRWNDRFVDLREGFLPRISRTGNPSLLLIASPGRGEIFVEQVQKYFKAPLGTAFDTPFFFDVIKTN
jgi:hypothetical protein